MIAFHYTKTFFLSYNSLLLHYKSVSHLRKKRIVFKKNKNVTEKLRNTGFRLRVIIKEFVVMYKVRPWFQKAQLVLIHLLLYYMICIHTWIWCHWSSALNLKAKSFGSCPSSPCCHRGKSTSWTGKHWPSGVQT